MPPTRCCNRKLSEIDGVGRVAVQGGLRPAVRVRVDPARLAAYGLAMEDVRTAVAAANVNGAKGGFDGPRRRSPWAPTTSWSIRRPTRTW